MSGADVIVLFLSALAVVGLGWFFFAPRKGQLAQVSEQLAGGPPEGRGGLVVVPKIGPTPGGFPRRPGVARKRPLA